MNLSLQQIAELTSLALTVPTLILAIFVIKVWWPALNINPKNAHQWFIVGVVAGFTGSFFNNLYWLFPWTASFLGMEITNQLIMFGVYFNIFFRQSLGIFAAYCHIRAALIETEKPFSILNGILVLSYAIGVSYSVFLVVLYSRC